MKPTIALLAALLAAMIAPAGAAHAGTYDVWSCRMPDGQRPAPIAGWVPFSVGAPPPSNDCGTWQGMRAAFQVFGLSASAVTGWSFEAPPHTAIAGYELYRSARAGAASDGSSRAFALYHDEPRFDALVHLFEFCTPNPQGCHQVGDPQATDPMDPDNRVARSGLRIKRLILRMECRSINGPVACGPADPSGSLRIGRARIALRDDTAPALVRPTGALVKPRAVLDGAAAVTVSANDVGGGVARFDVLVDGTPIATEPVDDRHPSCRAPFVDLVPCPSSVARSFAFDTSGVSNGAHRVQIAAIDAAGNRTLSVPVDVRIANGATPNGAGASRGARLVARFESTGRRAGRDRARVRFGGTRAILGRLRDERGTPIANARVDVLATSRHTGARQVQKGVVTTRADGSFRFLPRRGPSRRFELAYRAFSLDPDPSATAAVTLGVRAGVRLDVRPRRTTSRGTIRFRGRLRGGPGRGGVQVTLYAVGRSVRSRVPVAVLKTNAAGRFGFRYRFVRTFAPFTYRFVAQVQRQRGYPYDAASSRRVTVRVVR
jgi:hypothetical protein